MNDQSQNVYSEGSEKKFNISRILPSWRKLLLMGFGVIGVILLVLIAVYAVYTFAVREYKNIEVANVTPNSATVVWISPTKEPGVALAFRGEAPSRAVGKYGDGIVGYDDRDYSDAELDAARRTLNNTDGETKVSSSDIETEILVNNYGFYYVHHVTFKDLDPNTSYEALLGDGYVFKSDQDGRKVLFTTNTLADEVAKVPSPAYGIIYDDNGDPLTDGVVKVHIIDAEGMVVSDEIFAPLGENGSWYVDLNSLRTVTGEPFFEVYTDVEFHSMNEVVDVITNEGTYRTYFIPAEDSPAPNFSLSNNTLVSTGSVKEKLLSNIDELVFEANACDGVPCGGCFNHRCVSWSEFGSAGGCNELIAKKCGGGGDDNGGGGDGGDNNDPPPPQEPPPNNSGGGRCPGQVYCSSCGCKSYDWFKQNGFGGCADAEKAGKCGGGGGEDDNDPPDPTPPPPKESSNGKCCKTPAYNDTGDVYWNSSGDCYYGSVSKSENECKGGTPDPKETGTTKYRCCKVPGDSDGDWLFTSSCDHGEYTRTSKDSCEGTQKPPPADDDNQNTTNQGYCCDNGNTWQNVNSPIGNCKPGSNGYLGQMTYSQCQSKKPPPQEDPKPKDKGPLGACCTSASGKHTWAGSNNFRCSYGSAGNMTDSECEAKNSKQGEGEKEEDAPKTTYEICCYNKKGDKEYHSVRNTTGSCSSDYESRETGKEGSGWPGSCNGPKDKPKDPSPSGPKTTQPPKIEEPKEAQKVGNEVIESKYCDKNRGTCDPSDCGEGTTPRRDKDYEVIWEDEYKTQPKEIKWTFWYSCVRDPDSPPPPDPLKPPAEDPLVKHNCDEDYARDNNGTCNPNSCGSGTTRERRSWSEITYSSSDTYKVNPIVTWYYWYVCVKDSESNEDPDPADSICGRCIQDWAESKNGTCDKSDCGEGTTASRKETMDGCKLNEQPKYWYVCEVDDPPPPDLGPPKSGCTEGIANGYGGTCLEDCKDLCGSEEVCKKQEATPVGRQYPMEYYKCVDENQGNSVENKVTQFISKLTDLLTFKSFAQEEEPFELIFSPDARGYIVGDDGLYYFVYSGELYEVKLTGAEDTAYIIYIDQNGNSTYEPDADITVDQDPVTLLMSKQSGAYSYDIEVGFNYVSFNFIPDESGILASEFLQRLNTMYTEHEEPFYSISTYDSGKWKIIGSREGNIYGADDFQVVPGRGYILRSKYQYTLELTGFEVIDAVPVTFNQGWNLVAVHGGNTQYTAESWVDSIDAVNGLDADNVSRWDVSRGRYDGIQKSEGEVYGFDYPIFEQQAYFVRIVKGTGRWTPE